MAYLDIENVQLQSRINYHSERLKNDYIDVITVYT